MVMMLNFVKKISEKYFLLFSVGAIVLAVVIGSFWQKENSRLDRENEIETASESVKQSPLVILNQEQIESIPVVSAEDHIKGNSNASLTIIVYTDFECPFCNEYHSALFQILNEYNSDLRLIYRHYPVANTHPASPLLAEASECANELGGEDAFWKFADEVFKNKERFGNLQYAADSLNVDEAELEGCLKSRKYKDKVQASYEGGLRAGIRVTPSTFVMNDEGEVWFIPGAYSYEDLKILIEDSLD